MKSPFNQVNFLTRSETRVDLLSYLSDHGSATRDQLNDELDVSRSTLSRTLSAFEDRNLIEYDGTYTLTPVGNIVAEALLDCLDRVDDATDLAPFLQSFPITEYDLTTDQLRDAELTRATDIQPHAPIREHAEPIKSADSYYAILPAIIMQGKEEIRDRIISGDLDTEFIVPSDVAESIADSEMAAAFQEAIDRGTLAVFVADSSPPFFFSLVDDQLVQIGVSHDGTGPDVLLQTSDAAVRDWAETFYRKHRSAADRLTVADF